MAVVGEAEIIAVLNTTEAEAKLAALEDSSALGGLGGVGTTAEEDAAKDAEKASVKAEEDGSKAGGRFGESFAKKAGGSLENLGVPASLLTGAGLATVAVAGITAASIDLAMKMQSAEASIASAEEITVKAATNIGDAMEATAGKSEFSAQEMASAFGAVAGQMKQVNGAALTTKETLDFMSAAATLATATQTSLADATSTVAGVLQAFNLKSKDAADVTNILFNASKATGQSVDTLAGQLEKMKSKLGGVSPPLSQLGGLLVDMTNHGETGRAALAGLTTGFQTFLKPATDAAKAQAELKIAQDALPPSLQKLAAEYDAGKVKSSDLSKQTKNLSISQLAAFDAFKKASDAARSAGDASALLGVKVTGAKGALLPMTTIIGELHDKIKGMSDAQATATLAAAGFGSSASRWVSIVQAGPEALDKATASVTKHGAVQRAAGIESKTFGVEIKTLLATFEDFGTMLGKELLPILGQVIDIIKVLVPVIGEVLVGAIKVLMPTLDLVVGALKILVSGLSDLVNFVVDIFEGKWGAAWKNIEALFKNVWNLIKEVVFKIPDEIFGWLAKEIVKELEKLPKQLEDIGKDIVKGLVKGIMDQVHVAVDAAKHVGHAVEDGFKDVLSIFSPSKVMHAHGVNIVQGLADGIKDGSRIAEEAMRDMAKRVDEAGGFNKKPARGAKSGGGSSGGGGDINVAAGAVIIHMAPGNDDAVKSVAERAIAEGFKMLTSELRGGVSRLGRVAST